MPVEPETGTRDKPKESSDLELLQGIARGHEESFRTLFGRWAPRLGRFLLQVTGSRETAEDLLQEAFLRILKAAPRFQPGGSVGSWMHRICANLAYSHWRRRRASPFPGRVDPSILAEVPASSLDSPERLRTRQAFRQDVRAAVQQLPENHRMVFLLKLDQNLTYEEIAAVLGCPAGTAKSRFHHAVRKLRHTLRDWSENHGAQPRRHRRSQEESR
jgi:RNA polymerase sigma-70 factor (ECF subfamily)